MAKEKFEDRKLTGAFSVTCKYEDGTTRVWATRKEEVVRHIVQIVNQYAQEGYVLTLRQLHYQLVTNNWIINHDSAYKKLGNILDDCKYAGIIDWSNIEDRGRMPYIPYYVSGVDNALNDTVQQYRLDRQEGQDNYIELWTEKDALSAILRRSTEKYHIQLVVNKGYTSSSAAYQAYSRIVDRITKGQTVTVLYFGDHDPSGLDMVRDIRDRLNFFLCRGARLYKSEKFYDTMQKWWSEEEYDIHTLIEEGYCSTSIYKLLTEEDDNLVEDFDAGKIAKYLHDKNLFTVKHIGLTMEQIKLYKLPPNPTKLTDSRAEKYIAKFGKICWEVDALRPQILTSIVENNIEQIINMNQFSKMMLLERRDIKKLKSIIKSL